ncbi:MAG: hypothetical protein HY276_05205 [Ignavibacteriales bacterium]|nr:hypothetical protein [Ignavibacteriales bacterium]MBI3787639.1 hypothetical protein [Ignavibacteriales bacterium]
MSNILTEHLGVRHRNMTLIGIWLAFAFWIIETLIHTYIFRDGELLRNLFPAEPNELWMRTLVCCVLIVFGIYAQSAITKLKISEEERLKPRANAIPAVLISQAQLTGAPMIFLGLFGAVMFWIVEALIHTYSLHEGELLQNLLPHDSNELWMRLLVSCLLVALGIYAHRSITKLRRSEAERIALQKKLEDSLTRMLSGFIPICANCKNIREENNTWIQIEGYIERHSEVQFSHGICPKCAKLLYPEYTGDKK